MILFELDAQAKSGGQTWICVCVDLWTQLQHKLDAIVDTGFQLN